MLVDSKRLSSGKVTIAITYATNPKSNRGFLPALWGIESTVQVGDASAYPLTYKIG